MVAPNSPDYETISDARDAVADLPGVTSVAIRPVGEHEYGNRRLLSIVFAQVHGRVPPRLLSCLADHDLGIVDVSPQGSRLVVAAV